jgi:hypothetical protein
MIIHPFIIADVPVRVCLDPRDPPVEQREPVAVPACLMADDSVARAKREQREQRAKFLVLWLSNEATFRHWLTKFYQDDPLILMALAGESLVAYAKAARVLKEASHGE